MAASKGLPQKVSGKKGAAARSVTPGKSKSLGAASKGGQAMPTMHTGKKGLAAGGMSKQQTMKGAKSLTKGRGY